MHQAYNLRLPHQALGLPFTCTAAADVKPLARKWLKHHFGGKVSHIFHANQNIIDGSGECELHASSDLGRPLPQKRKQKSQAQCFRSLSTPDLAVAGLPCQSFSRLRSSGPKLPHEHCTYPVVEEWLEYLSRIRPKAWWVENVDSMDSTDVRQPGATYASAFADACARSLNPAALKMATWPLKINV